MKRVLADLDKEELEELVNEAGEQSYRAKQIFQGIHQYKDIEEMNLPKNLKDYLSERFYGKGAVITESVKGADGTEKYLFLLNDGNVVEGVLMRYKYGNTLCVSTQVGCRMGCKFCASTLGGLVRNMTAGEILSEALSVNSLGGLKDRFITNVVLMGSGEPLDNYDEVVKFLKLITVEGGINISARNISLSTCGLVDNIKRLAREGIKVNLTVSLHSPFDDKRREIMPIANKYSIKEILEGCSDYFEKTGRRYIFEYTLISGKNDGRAEIDELIRLLRGRPCHVNIIRLNEVKESKLKSVATRSAYEFAEELVKGGLSATVRRKMGEDIEGACGQLRRKFIGESN